MKGLLILISFFWTFNCSYLHAQVLPVSRSTNWKIAGLRDTTTAGFQYIDMQSAGAVGDGITPNDSVMSAVLAGIPSSGAILAFPAGDFLFNQSIQIGSNTLIIGEGPGLTTFTLSLGGSGHGIRLQGSLLASDTSSVTNMVVKDLDYLIVMNPMLFNTGDWIRIIQDDSALVTSAWALKTAGQIVQIVAISGDTLMLASPLRMNYDPANKPLVCKINPVKNSGLQCLKIIRTDNTAPEQTSNVYLSYAVNCFISGLETVNGNFSHIEAENSSNLLISKSYIHHAFEYGEGGRGYGVILHFTTGECRVEDNIFEHLRHSMLLQAGANGNVFAYNYSCDPYWTTFPANSAGEMVLHGNYVYANLFEQNICQNIVIDNSHGPNGPFNTFFRNRAGGYGIFFSAANSPDQNFIGNEIPNTSFPYSLVNYTILGSGHFQYGNNNKGTLVPAGTAVLPDTSYAYTARPSFVPPGQWGGIGTPHTMGSISIPASDRYLSGNLFYNACGTGAVGIADFSAGNRHIGVSPNPFCSGTTIHVSSDVIAFSIFNSTGQQILKYNNPLLTNYIDTRFWPSGVYSIRFLLKNNLYQVQKLIRVR